MWLIPLPRAASTAQSTLGFVVLVPSMALGCPLWLTAVMDQSLEIISYKQFPFSFSVPCLPESVFSAYL